MLFDTPLYTAINEARWKVAQHILLELQNMQLRSCLDVGCGSGWFTQRLLSIADWRVHGVDGRADLVEVARAKAPDAAHPCHSCEFYVAKTAQRRS